MNSKPTVLVKQPLGTNLKTNSQSVLSLEQQQTNHRSQKAVVIKLKNINVECGSHVLQTLNDYKDEEQKSGDEITRRPVTNLIENFHNQQLSHLQLHEGSTNAPSQLSDKKASMRY